MQYASLEDAYGDFNNQVPKFRNKKKNCEKFINDYSQSQDCYYNNEGIPMPSCEKFSNANGNANANANANGNANVNANANSNANANVNANANANRNGNGNGNGNANGNGNGNGNANGNANGNGNGNGNGNANGNGNRNTNTYEGYASYDSYANYASINNKDCSPLQPPSYTLPIDSNSKNAFNKALETSLNTNVNEYEKNNPNKFSIKPYDYDEYDAYLNISDIKTNNKDETPEYRTTPFLEEYLKNLRDNFKTPVKDQGIKINDIEQFTNFINNANNIKVDINLYNLFLFIFIGIIIILLCDQITKLAIIVANKNI
jgi:hypothetical protein